MEALLRAHEHPATCSIRPRASRLRGHKRHAASGLVAAAFVAARSPRARGTRIGPYRLLQSIGEGGMGVVFMAEQESPVRRKVALKVIKPGMDSAQVIARFEAERQALGADGPPQHRQGVRRRHHRERPAILRHGARPAACRSPSIATATG